MQPPAATATGTTNEYLLEIATGSGGAEVLLAQIPFVVRNVTAAGYIPSLVLPLPQGLAVAANTRLSLRVAYSVATTVSTLTGIKIVYRT